MGLFCPAIDQAVRPVMLVMAWNRACSVIVSPFEAATCRMAAYTWEPGARLTSTPARSELPSA